MRRLFIINPVAGGKKHDPKKTEANIREVMEKQGVDYEIYYTTEAGDGCRKTREVAVSGEDAYIYACGGDGTLNECITGAAGNKNIAVAHYPCGTGNDFIKCFEDERERFFDLNQLINGEVRPVDVISCGNGRYGLNIASVGIDARIGADVHKYSHLPLIGGAGGYVVSTFVNIFKGVNQEMTITAGNETITGKFAMVCACNGRYYGGGFNPVPEAVPDDGELDILIVKEVSFPKLVAMLGDYAAGKYKKHPKHIRHIKAKTITIEGPKEILIGYDGETFYGKRVTFDLINGGVNMLFPANMNFFDKRMKQTAEK